MAKAGPEPGCGPTRAGKANFQGLITVRPAWRGTVAGRNSGRLTPHPMDALLLRVSSG